MKIVKGFLTVFFILLGIGWLMQKVGCNDPNTEIIDGVPTVTIVVSSSDGLKLAAHKIGTGAYATTMKYSDAATEVVVVKMRSFGLTDEYGYQVKGDLEMGKITVSDLAEVRKYRDENAYAYSDAITLYYMMLIKSMRYAYLLGDQ